MATNFSKYGVQPTTTPTTPTTTDMTKYGVPVDGFQNIQSAQSGSVFEPTFKASKSDTPVQAGLKAAGNLPSSALRFGKGIYDIVTNPIESTKAIGSVALGGFQKLIPGQQGSEAAFNDFTKTLKDRYGSLENLQKTATEDPFGFGTDLASLFAGGAAITGRTAQAAKLASKTAKTVTTPTKAIAGAAGDFVRGTTGFAASQSTGLNPSTIAEVIKNPSAFAKSATQPSRTQIAEAVGQALDSSLDELSELGKGYEGIRGLPDTVTIPGDLVAQTLNKYGIKLEDGKVVTSPESRPLTAVDKAAIERFIENYGQQNVLSGNAFLNVREALSQLAKYEDGKSNLSNTVARDLRSRYDELGKNQLPGLRDLDAEYAPQRQLLSQLKRDIFDAQGNLKDGSISKIANLTGKGKEQLLGRVKQIVPDIEERINVLRAVEDIEAASGLKVGTYIRSGAAVGGVLTGNIPVVIGAILAQPEVAVPLLRAYGYTGQKAAEVLRPLRTILEDVNNFRIPTPVIDYLREAQPGLSMKNVGPKPATASLKNAQSYEKEAASFLKGLEKHDTKGVALDMIDDLYDVLWRAKPIKGGETRAQFLTAARNVLNPYVTDDIFQWGDQKLIRFVEAVKMAIKKKDDKWTGIKSSKQSKAADISTGNAPTGRGDVSVPKEE